MSEGLRLIRAIIDRGATETLREITEDMFVDDDELAAYNFLRRHFRSYSELPTTPTVEEGAQVELPDAPESVDFYIHAIYNRGLFNEVRPVFNDLRQALMNMDAEGAREHISQLQRASRTRNAEQDVFMLGEMGRGVVERIEMNKLNMGLTGISTGWPYLDEQTGGWQNGDFNAFVARPAMGKTHLLIHGARSSWMAGRSVLFASMEMPHDQIANRFFGHHAGVNPDLVRKAKLSNFARRRIDSAVTELAADNSFYLFAGGFKHKNADELDILIQELAPDIIYVDGFYLMRSTQAPTRTDRFQMVGYIADDMKGVATRRNRPVVGSTQFGRGAGKGGRDGGLENIAYSDALATHCSVMIGIKKPQNDRSEHPKTRLLELMKGREGEQGQWHVKFQLAPVCFDQTTEEEAAASSVDLDWMPPS